MAEPGEEERLLAWCQMRAAETAAMYVHQTAIFVSLRNAR